MSELITNREYRKEKIIEIVQALQQGKSLAEVKEDYAKLVKDLPPIQLTALEQQLINEGLPREEVSKLGDLLLQDFKRNMQNPPEQKLEPGHPIHTFQLENLAIEKLIGEIKTLQEKLHKDPSQDILFQLREKINLLWDVEKHYSRKENVLFPFLEKYEITGPSRIMWTHDDEIRELLKEVKKISAAYEPRDQEQFKQRLDLLLQKISEMIGKEENVIFKTALKILSDQEWYEILQDSAEIGYCLIDPENKWRPVDPNGSYSTQEANVEMNKGFLKFDTGILTPEEIGLIFDHLPIDITYVDKEGLVKYFSANKDRIFVRSRSIIGRKVENCHPPASVDIVEKLVEDLASGKKDFEDFWLHLGDKYVLIRYIALRSQSGKFIGVVECTQDIKPIQAITGEKRIAD